MTRLNQAWQALMGRLPETREVVREVTILGSPEPVTLYEARAKVYQSYGEVEFALIARYHTCEQAHAEHPGKVVTAAKYWRIGDTYLAGLKVVPIEIQPKPKIAKGKRT